MGDNGDGTHTGRFTLPDLQADMLRKALSALAAPKRVRSQGETYDHTRPNGGPTDTDHAQLLCPRHHALTHRDPPDPPMRT